MKNQMNLLISLGFSDSIKGKNEIAMNVGKGLLQQAMHVGITSEEEEGYVTDIKVRELNGTTRMHVNFDGFAPQFLPVEDQTFMHGPSEKQKAAMTLVATGLLSIAHDMQTDDKFRAWIESTSFFNHFNQCIDEVGHLIHNIIPED